MRIRHRSSSRSRQTIALNLASMIDVTFLLLLYFIVTTVLTKPEDRLSPSLQTRAESAVGPQSDFQPQTVDVLMFDGAPAFRLGAEVMRTKRDLVAALAPLHKPTGLFVQVSDDVPVSAAVAALQAGRDAGFDQVTYVPAKTK